MTDRLLDGKVAVVSGSTRGIGRAMAETFADHGARVVINGRSEQDAAAVAREIPGSLAVGGDMSDHGAINALVNRVSAELGVIDILVNNAAISRRSAVTRVSDEEWLEVMRQLPPELLEPMEKSLADPADVADVALFLVSDLSRSVTGQIVSAGSGAHLTT